MLSSGTIKRGIKLTLLFLFLPILMALSVNDFDTRIDSTYITDAPSGYGEPSPMANKVGILVTSTGISRQVQDNYSVTLEDTVNISADGERTPLDFASGGLKSALDYQWSMVTPNKTWNDIEGAKSNTLKFTPHQEGTYWFQLKITYYIQNLLNPFYPYQNNMYTKVAKVIVTKNRVKVDSIDIKTSSDYIYNKRNFFNDNSTYASAIIKPTNSTEQVKWSLVQNDKLAEIGDNGQIKANLVSDEDNQSGEIEVRATANHDLQETKLVHMAKKINVGGGLLDTHASVGNSALFEIQGIDSPKSRIATNNINITWECKKKGTDKYQDISSSNKSDNKFEFKTSDVSLSDDGDLYRATIKTSINNEEQSYTTNPARLIVNPNEDSDVDFSVKVENYFFKDPQNTNTKLNNIKSKDEIAYTVTITNHTKSIINSSNLTLLVPKETETDSDHILIPDKNNELKNPVHIIDGEVQKLTFEILSLKPQETRKFEIDILAPVIDKKQTLTFKPTLSYTNMGQRNEITSSELNFTFVTNRLELHPQSIIFEPITLFDKNIIKHRTSSDTPITIDDEIINRPERTSLYLQQTSDFMDKSNHTLPFHLLFYKPDGSITDLKNNTLIATSEPYAPLGPIHWDRNHGPLLHIDNATNLTPGNYSADITWTVEQVPPNDDKKTSPS